MSSADQHILVDNTEDKAIPVKVLNPTQATINNVIASGDYVSSFYSPYTLRLLIWGTYLALAHRLFHR
jgi:hypothetical protein